MDFRSRRSGRSRLALVAFLFVPLYLALAGGAIAAPILDQQQPIVDLSIGGLAIGGGSQQALAQT
jgi:hypothetical protein